MIIAIQAALMCEDVTYDENGRPTYVNVVGGDLASPTVPGLEPIRIILHLATDRRPGAATITVSAQDWSEAFSFSYPGDVDLTGADLALAVPIFEPGRLEVVVDNEEGATFAVAWRLSFTPDAVTMPDPAARDRLLEGAREAGQMMRDVLMERQP